MKSAAVQAAPIASQAIGANNPPEPAAYVESREEIDALMIEARNWLDGEPIASQEQADSVARLMTLLSEASKRADTRRKAEAKPHDDAKAEIQERWNRLIGDNKSSRGTAVLALAACRQALLPWEVAQRKAREAEAARLRAEAEAARREAALATQLAAPTNLVERENADAIAREAAALERDARRAENAKSATTGGGRALSVAGRPVAVVTDLAEFSEHAFRHHRARYAELMGVLAQEIANARVTNIPGVRIDTAHTVRG